MKQNKLSPGSNQRWESSRMMIIEHVELIREYVRNQDKIEKPIHGVDKLNEINECVRIAIEDYTPIVLSIYSDGYIRKHRYCINKYDPVTKRLIGMDEDEKVHINVSDIVDARLI